MLPELDRTQSLRILLAEDHLINQKLALLMLEHLGYQADVAENGLDVLEALQRQLYDVVLLDVRMPAMNGLEVTRWICQQWQPSVRPYLIAMTANAMRGDRESCLSAGMDYYMSKPICMQELAQVLSQCKPLQASIALPPDTTPAPARPSTAATPIPDISVLDLTVLATFRQEMGETGNTVVAELIACYLAETPLLLHSIRTALSQYKVEDVQRIAHGLKTSSACLGAMCLSQYCRALEAVALSASIDQLAEALLRLEFEYHRVEVALRYAQSHQLS